MVFIINGHEEVNAVQTIIQVFYPNLTYAQAEKPANIGITVESGSFGRSVWAKLYKDGILQEYKNIEYDGSSRHLRRQIKYTIYYILQKETGIDPPWGLLTGIRPAKVVNDLMEWGYSEQDALKYMGEYYCAKPGKAALAMAVAKREQTIIKNNNGRDGALYIGIPFCPSRCLYCSFTSYPIQKYEKKLPAYAEALLKEMAYAAGFFQHRRLESVYIGGGTPTSIASGHLERILAGMAERVDISGLKEFTVEAGRPDTITNENLKILKKYHVSRISINPQTTNDRTLTTIGRKHTAGDFRQAFFLARNMGFHDINVDIIVGLPGETVEDVEHTLMDIAALNPESITVHTLSVKRAARLKEELAVHQMTSAETIEQMLAVAGKYTANIGMAPYYMYRQKNMVGNFENVGYAKPGHEGVYNVQIMEEKQSIIALGAGASSKYVNFGTGRIERAFNVKDPDDYINRIEEMIQRKIRLEEVLC